MEIKQKPIPELNAQIALFTAARVEEIDHPRLGDNISSLMTNTLLGAISSGSITGKIPEKITAPRQRRFIDPFSREILAEKGDEAVIFIADTYINFLRQNYNRRMVRNLAAMQNAYSQFKDQVKALDIFEARDVEDAKKHPNFLSYGGSNLAYYATLNIEGEDKECVLLVGQRNGPDMANSRSIPLSLGKGLKGFEQGIAASYYPPVVISERAPGSNLFEIDIKLVKSEHLEELQGLIQTATENNIYIDGNSDNFLYDPSEGFTIIDYRNNTNLDPKTLLERNMDNVAPIIQMIRDGRAFTKQ